MSRAKKADSYEAEVADAERRRDELVASDPTIHRHGDQQPEDGRDVYSIYLHRESAGGGYVAHYWPWDLEQKYRVMYAKYVIK